MKKLYKYILSIIFIIFSLCCIYKVTTKINLGYIEKNAVKETITTEKNEEISIEDLSYYGGKKKSLTDSEIWKRNLEFDLKKSKNNEFWDLPKPCSIINENITNPILFYYFEPRKLVLDSKYDENIVEYSNYLNINQDKKVLIYGYADLLENSFENDKYINLKEISLKRANNIKEKFIENGIDSDRIKVLAFEDNYPVDFDKLTPSLCNRRVMIFIYDSTKFK